MDKKRAFVMLTGLVLAAVICLLVLAGLTLNRAHADPIMAFADTETNASTAAH